MKKLKQLLAFVIMLTILISSLPLHAGAEQAHNNEASTSQISHIESNNEFSDYGTGDLSLSIKNPDNPSVISSVSDYFELAHANQNSKKDVAPIGASSLPSSVDNSLSPYFPEIENQGSIGSCVAFSCVYYQFTYEMNKSRGVKTTKDNTFSVKWTYNLINHGIDAGSAYFNAYDLLNQHGCPSSKSVPYDTTDYLSWSTDEKIWREAMRYRIDDYQLFDSIGKEGKEITSSDDPDLLPIKTALSNGDVLSCSTYINGWEKKELKSNPDTPENDKFANEQYLRCMPYTDGSHRITIVGYNDELWCDINENDKVDDGEMGALKIANSWGTDYGNDGFLWVAYDALNMVSCVDGVIDNPKRDRPITEVTRIDVRPENKGNDIYVKLTVNTANRSQFYAILSSTLHGSEYKRYLLGEAAYYGPTNSYAFDGTKTACDATLLYPLDDLSPTLTPNNFEDHNFDILIKDSTSDSSSVTVKNISLVNEHTGKEYKVNANYPVSVNGSEFSSNIKEKTTDSVVVYYTGFDNPNLHYKNANGSFTKVKMQENDERHGYLYKYVFERTNSDVTLYFSDDSGKIDNNNGSYYTAKNGLNYYYTKGQREPLEITDLKLTNGTPDVGQKCLLDFNTTGGYEPYKYKYTLEDLNTGKIQTIDYHLLYSANPLRFSSETTYKITVEVMDYAKQTAVTSMIIEVTDHPLEIAQLSADKQNGIVSKEMKFSSTTAFEGLSSGGYTPKSHFVIKDSTGKVWFDDMVKYTTYDMGIRTTTTVCGFIPQKAGEYTLTVSLTDYNKEYAEKTINFTVYDMIYGDADGNGAVNIMDATIIQYHLANIDTKGNIYLDLADCDTKESVNIMDATTVQLYLAHKENSGKTGNVIEYVPPTQEETIKPTEEPTVVKSNTVTFTNSLNWSGTIYCYYWSDQNTAMTSWPGKAMTNSGSNEFAQTLYTFDVPNGANYLIFTNGSSQTVDIKYSGGEVKYYALNTKTGNGYNVETW